MSGNRSRILLHLARKICERDESNTRHESMGLYSHQPFVTNESENHNIPIVKDSVTNKLQGTTFINESSKIASPLAEKQYGQCFHMAVDFENKENQKSPTIDETTGTEDEI
uniref:Uncharacterized protein LOC114332351 n=1 Tax=Diabrotica virgifera virgifera TaxID=50390 RepID=A0A6P7FNM2_DIAVI